MKRQGVQAPHFRYQELAIKCELVTLDLLCRTIHFTYLWGLW